MACNPNEILLYIEGELGPEAAARVRAHTARCDSCRELLLTEQALESALGGLRDLAPPPDFTAATVRRAECDVTNTLYSSHERRRAAAITVALGTITIFLLWPTGVFGTVVEMLAPTRCMARFAFGWVEKWALGAFIVFRTISHNLFEEASLPVGAAFLVLGLLVALLVWLIAGYRKHATASERDIVR